MRRRDLRSWMSLRTSMRSWRRRLKRTKLHMLRGFRHWRGSLRLSRRSVWTWRRGWMSISRRTCRWRRNCRLSCRVWRVRSMKRKIYQLRRLNRWNNRWLRSRLKSSRLTLSMRRKSYWWKTKSSISRIIRIRPERKWYKKLRSLRSSWLRLKRIERMTRLCIKAQWLSRSRSWKGSIKKNWKKWQRIMKKDKIKSKNDSKL